MDEQFEELVGEGSKMPGSIKTNTFVLAGSYSEFYYSKYHIDGYTYVCETYSLLGRRNYKIIFSGTYYEHRNYEKILLAAKMADAEIIYD